MEPKKLRLLLIVGIAAMVISVVCFIGVSSLMQSVSERADRVKRAEGVIGDLTWDEILATSSERRAAQEEEAAASASASAAQQSASAAPKSTASAKPSSSASASAAGGASAAASATTSSSARTSASPGPSASSSAAASASATMDPATRPTVLIGGGLVPYDNRKFEVSSGAIREAGYMKVLKSVRDSGLRAQDITWEVDVPDADDVHVMSNGTRLGDKDVVGTGTIVELYDGDTVIDTAVVVIPGDVTGTGEVNAAQIAALQKAVTNPQALQGAFLLAGDLDGNGKIEEADVALLRERVGGAEE